MKSISQHFCSKETVSILIQKATALLPLGVGYY
jgi:hypothetical protein